MPLLIDSAPGCITHVEKASPDDMADFILQANYEKCAGFMTFGHGSTYGSDGVAATTQYYFLIWLGAAVMVAAFVAWLLYENRMMLRYAITHAIPSGGDGDGAPPGPAAGMTTTP
jgi:hypothetical protein